MKYLIDKITEFYNINKKRLIKIEKKVWLENLSKNEYFGKNKDKIKWFVDY